MEMTDKTTGETHTNTGRGLNLYTHEDGRWKIATQQQRSPHFALFQKPEMQREFVANDPDTLTEDPLSWKRRKLIAGAQPFQDQLEVSLAFKNISGSEVRLSLKEPENERVLASTVTPPILPAGESGKLEVTFDTSSRVDERFTFTLGVNDQEQEVAVMVHARNVISINGKIRYSTKLNSAPPPRIYTPILIENAKIDVVDKPSGLSVRLTPDDSGILWDIELEPVGDQVTGEVRFGLTADDGTAEAVLVVEE